MARSPSDPRPSAFCEWVCAFGVAAFALLVRALPFANVFHAGQVIFAPADAMYHVRRSYYTFESWPRVLLSDPYVNYPDGAPIPWSPGPDFLAGTLAALLARSDAGFEHVLAWWPAWVGALGALPIYFLAREIGPRAVAVGAGCLYALLPISVVYGRVGNPDHHVAVAAVGACLLLVCVKLVAPGSGRQRWGLALALALARAALLLTWHGSLLYLAVAETALLIFAALADRREVHAAHAASAVGTLLLVGPMLASFPTPLLGLYSSIALSRLHLIAVAVAGAVALAGWLRASRAGQRRSEWSALARLGFLAGVGVVFALAVLALPGPRAGLEPALRFLTMTDAAGAKTVEQFALFSIFGRSTERAAADTWGAYAYLLPLAPVALVFWARASAAGRAQSLFVAAWAAVFAILALSQRRYGNDLAAAACVAFAIGGAQLARLLVARLGLSRASSGAAIVALGAALYAQPIANLYLPWARQAAAKLQSAPGERRGPPPTPAWAIHRFLRAVRSVTPETTGYTHPAASPEYGIVSQANLGHALQWVARRATPTDPFWEYIGPENWDRAFALLTAEREATAAAIAQQLSARYVVVGPSATRGRIGDRLFRDDGLRRDPQPALRRFRLVTEGPRGGQPIQAMYQAPIERPQEFVPYKLFEIVRGARLEIAAAAGTRVEASLVVRTPTGRSFTYRTATRAGEDGTARLRVPYANQPDRDPDPERVTTDASWTIRAGGIDHALHVPESAVLEGTTLETAVPLSETNH